MSVCVRRLPPTASGIALLALVSALATGCVGAASEMQRDVHRLVRAAEASTDTWPSQPPPAIAEVAVVARHGKAVAPLLLALLSDRPDADRDRPRWRVQQQASLALAHVYSESRHCGRVYCDADPPERIRRVKEGWLRVIAFDREMRTLSVRELLARFTREDVFWRQLEIGRALAAAGDRAAIPELEAWLTHDDRHVRGNVALVLGRLGDPRGFDTLAAMLHDRSARPIGQGGEHNGRWSLERQIRSDRYHAVHLLGELKDPRGVDLLVPLLADDDVGYKVPWSLAEIGDRRAIGPLIEHLDRDDPSVRVYTISALESLGAREAVPRLRELLQDTRRSNLGDPVSVAEAARHAIAVLSQAR